MASESSELDAEGHLSAAAAFLSDAERMVALRGTPNEARPGWIITAAFYASLHVISAYTFARHGVKVAAHRDRTDWFRDYPELATDRFAFVSLKKRSEAFRYYAEPVTWSGADEALSAARRMNAKWSDRTRKALGA